MEKHKDKNKTDIKIKEIKIDNNSYQKRNPKIIY